MKLFSSEVGHNYDSYTFGYVQYCIRESGDTLGEIYNAGYLPYSGASGVQDIFYMARSARILLPQFTFTSENRRIAKKFDGQFEKERIAFKKFNRTKEFIDFCLAYFSSRHGTSVMPRERLEFILDSNLISNTMIYHSKNKPVAYALEVGEGAIGHYWYSFFDPSLAHQSLGLWLMQDAILDAQKRRLSHYYLGTVYGEKALYKTNFKSLEWWDGSAWNTDIKLLKERSRSDSERIISIKDIWKEGQTLF